MHTATRKVDHFTSRLTGDNSKQQCTYYRPVLQTSLRWSTILLLHRDLEFFQNASILITTILPDRDQWSNYNNPSFAKIHQSSPEIFEDEGATKPHFIIIENVLKHWKTL